MKEHVLPESVDRISHDRLPVFSLDLWKWFQDDAARVKDKMWTISAAFYTIFTAFLGFIGKYLKDEDGGISVDQPILVASVSLTGAILSVYAMYMISQYGRHLVSGWNRADYIKRRIEGLNDVWYLGRTEDIAVDMEREGKETKTIPPVAKRLVILTLFYAVLFFIALVASLLSIQAG